MIIQVMVVKILNIYGQAQIFISLAIILTGMHIMVLASIESIPDAAVALAFAGIILSVLTIVLNFRRRVE